MSRLRQVPSGDVDSDSETLNIAQGLHRVGQIRVAVVGESRLAEIVSGDRSEGTAGADNFDAVAEPTDANRRVRRFIRSVHNGVAGNLLQGFRRIQCGA